MTPRTPKDFDSQNDFSQDEDFRDAPASAHSRGFKGKRLLLDLLGRWYWIALGLILGVLCSAYYLSKAPKEYTTASTLLVKQQAATVFSRDQEEELDVRSLEGLNTMLVQIARPELLERVATRTDIRSLPGLMAPQVDWRPQWLANWMSGGKNSDSAQKTTTQVPPPPALAGWIGSRMSLAVRPRTRLVDISFSHVNPDVAKALADAVAREFISELEEKLTDGRSTQTDTLLRQSEETRGKLQAAESALATYNRALELHTVLEAREKEVSQLARRYLPKHPKMISANGELAELKARFIEEFSVAISSPSDKAYWQTVEEQLAATRDDPEARLRLARQLLLARTGVLRSEISSQMSVFNMMLTRIEESNVNSEGEASAVEINSLARVPGSPSSPQPSNIHTKGAAGGLAFGLAIAFLLVRIDNKFHSVAQTEEETELPVLAAISDINTSHLTQACRAYARKHPDEPVDPIQELWDPHLLFRPGTLSTNFAEMFRILRASLSLLGDESKRKITLFSSALPGEGKTTVSANFAMATAGQGRKTLLIDLDLRKPSVHRVFGFARSETGPGVTEWLAGQVPFDDIVTQNVGAGPNLHVMFSGKRAPNPGELLNVARLGQLFAEASKRYDHIVIDSAPLLAVPDTRVVIPLVDNFALVARANYVPKGAVIRALELLESSGSSPAGIVLNGFKESRRMIGQNYTYGSYRLSKYGQPYQYGYGTYGSYGSDDDDDDDDKALAKRKRQQKSRG